MAATRPGYIAHYRILKRIGRGGMGIVYQAEDERDGRIVALKVIRDAETAGEDGAIHAREARVRFDREAEILRSLLHVNVVAFYEIGEEDGTPWLAMEFLDGVPLTSLAGRPWTGTAPLLIQAAHGLEYLSSRGIVHRDLSPDNILVIDRGGERIVKLLDFGVAKMFDRTAGLESLTAAGFFLGKVAYGSPEQLGSLGADAELDWRSDVYSLGIIFYQVLSGRRPFEGKIPLEFIAAHLNIEPAPVAAPPDAPPLPIDLVRLVSRMLAKRREDRPGTWREIVDGLVAALREAGLPTGRPPVLPSASPMLPAPTTHTALVSKEETGPLPAPTFSGRRALAWVAAAAGLALAGGIAYQVLRSASTPPPGPAVAARPEAPLAPPRSAPAAPPGRL
ncbi:MAG TPA: serine/threonine-protein kinase, partial [Thermoanaerobaculia bacterium]|nr:serine/threonine-protein kinase [Thermoanaerobaculia bacterium]